MNTNNPKPILCVAGLSGGHILPCLTLGARYAPAPIIFCSNNTSLDRSLISADKRVHAHVTFTLERHPKQKPLRAIAQLTWAFFKSIKLLLRTKPKRIISTGGLVSIPICYAAWLLRIPIDLYELNVHPGQATCAIAPIATNIYCCFGQAAQHLKQKATRTPYPLRFCPEDVPTREQVRRQLNIPQSTLVVCIAGGSQGSQSINSIIQRTIEKYPTLFLKSFIMHQVGSKKDVCSLENWYTMHKIPALVFSYRDDLPHCYKAADIVIARAGAGTLFELAALKVTSVIIPLEIAGGHQVHNAHAIADMYPDLFTVVRQSAYGDDVNTLASIVSKQKTRRSERSTKPGMIAPPSCMP